VVILDEGDERSVPYITPHYSELWCPRVSILQTRSRGTSVASSMWPSRAMIFTVVWTVPDTCAVVTACLVR
jgi:hypothetical protein